MKLIKVGMGLGLFRVLVIQDPGEITADHEQRRQRLAGSAKCAHAAINGLLSRSLVSSFWTFVSSFHAAWLSRARVM